MAFPRSDVSQGSVVWVQLCRRGPRLDHQPPRPQQGEDGTEFTSGKAQAQGLC